MLLDDPDLERSHPQRWQPPPLDLLKINIDASFLQTSEFGSQPTANRGESKNRVAISCICRDFKGRVIDGFAKVVAASSAEQAEASALLETLIYFSDRTHLPL